MAELSNPFDLPALESLLLPFPLLEAELRSLFNQIAATEDADLSGLINRCIRQIRRRKARCPDLKNKVETLVLELLMTSRLQAPSSVEVDRKRRKSDDYLRNMLTLLKGVATDPCDDRAGEARDWEGHVMRARKWLFVKPDESAGAEDFPYKKLKRHNYHSELSQGISSKIINIPKRRSQRLLDLEKFGEILSTEPSVRIPIGKHAQADVPCWVCPLERHSCSEEDLHESRWLGTTVWPVKETNSEINLDTVGKGRLDCCSCVSPGSVECVKLHVSTSRLCLKAELGPVFHDWCFEQMGEVVSRTWTRKEQVKFDEIVKHNSDSVGMNFWEAALKHFITKSRKDISSYFFNVYVLRRFRVYTRLKSEAAESDVDDVGSRFVKDITDSVEQHSKSYEKRYLKRSS
ncbi:hypothetical protein HPP92_019266 [Vanilla planifolia]|uniref:Uncharacterized protein n=1 Tax=Vanilla planifolia TaxID=51239 RepID=A0A835QBG7_VANPL|nr:hypothetical protein HPP92_019266 [Vanilla planifolia]